MPTEYLTPDEAASLMRCSRRTIYRWINSPAGLPGCSKAPGARGWLIYRPALERALAAGRPKN